MSLPRLVIAAPASGHGKTTVATGLMAALARAGHVVSGHKVGPDYIDPGYHSLATGRPGRNLDPHLVGESRLVPLLLHGAAGADIAVIEGVMGLYDGQIGGNGFASTAHVAALTRTPVVLVVDVSHASRSIAATVHGMTTWDASVEVVGVILNKAGSVRHADEVLASLAPSGLPVLGVLQRDDGILAPSRHLGLVPAAERSDAAHALDRLAAQVGASVDLDAVVRLARAAPDLAGLPWSAAGALESCDPAATGRLDIARNVRRAGGHGGDTAGSPRLIAMAGGRAFTFQYAETEELLRAAGCDVVTFDPTIDEALPEGTTGIYLGGGFPEMHAPDLSANTRLREDLRRAIAAGVPTVAECAGLLYLCQSVRPPKGPAVSMVGALEAHAEMGPRLTLSYRTATAASTHLLADRGDRVTGHEFHRTILTGDHPATAWSYDTTEGPLVSGFASPTLNASYLHTHWAGHPRLAQRFAAAASRPWTGRASEAAPNRLAAPTTWAPDLRHHGDREATEGLLDFAVNVYDGPRPPWLDEAIRDSMTRLDRYPDASRAQQALARRHQRPVDEVLPTAGAAEAVGLIARLRDWRHPVVVHPQFTEPDVALAESGHTPEHVVLEHHNGFRLDPALVPERADVVVIGNPTNPTGVLHPASVIAGLLRPGRLVVVDEAFLEDGRESLTALSDEGLLVVRSLTKLWSIPGLRAGYLLGGAHTIAALRNGQTPWSVSTPAAAAMVACSAREATTESSRRTALVRGRRAHLVDGLRRLAIDHVTGDAGTPFVLARPGVGVREALRDQGFAVRRADSFPGLDASWARIAVRPTEVTDRLLAALGSVV